MAAPLHLSPVFKSSPHCLPSPDGLFVATLSTSHISVRAVETLSIVRTIKLPADLGRSITTFVWSPTARRILICAADEIHVYSALDGDFHAAIRNPSATIGKLTFVDFGATDGEVCVCSAHGIRLSLFNLASSKVVEISNPKFYTASSAARGFSFRPHTRHLALLTRTSGKDTVSIHGPDSRHVQRSWNPDTVDAQGLAWTPDGKWLVMWESASQGHRVAFLTPDGHKYRDWPGSPPPAFDDLHDRLGAGVKLVVSSPNSQSIAVGDYSRCISVVQLASLTNQLQLRHSTTVEPKDTLQIWQEQIEQNKSGGLARTFIRANQPLSPSTKASTNPQELKTGPLFILFDSSSALLAVVLEDAPSTLWVWDVTVSELRAVLMFHTEISRVEWHPSQAELLLVYCEGEDHDGVVFVWDPLSDGPRSADIKHNLPGGKLSGKLTTCWLRTPMGPASLFFADEKSCFLGSVTDSDVDVDHVPWRMYQAMSCVDRSLAAQSPRDSTREIAGDDSDLGDDASPLDDTFHFKKSGGAE